MEKFRRGDIFYANLNPVTGSEQGGTRPVLIIQNDKGNKCSPTVIVAAITGSKKARQPTHVFVHGLPYPKHDSTILLEQIRTIDKHRLQKYLGKITPAIQKKVDKALTVSIGIRVS